MILFKKTILLFVITLFGFNIITQFSENLYSELLLIRNRYYIENNDKIIIIKVPKSNWISETNKKEITYKNAYFDIKKVIVNNNEVILFAVEDSFEKILKFIEKSLVNKKDAEKNSFKLKRAIDLYFTVSLDTKTNLSINKEGILIRHIQPFFHSTSIKPTIKPPII